MDVPTLALRAAFFVVLLGSVNLAFTGEPALGIVGAVAAVSLYLHFRREVEDAE